ncbi:TetR/AcrR family transcriptional regulator [Alcanivorax profundi]|uniref:TetR/AcrR family transcriptional regulator n=1 Tax=Alcanivorax profundi TaxID=2338368 RepID=A0A418XYX2_9GAMM|nr:TetR/AcrR family transcriptional regulator [Alcanivorax profundi]RJG18225.1 TetR/AcrR family transcriptional regulator [Alcanivorax profundi]
MAKKAKTDAEIAAFRESVCDAATRLFIERGPQNVTMRQIASELGVSPMTPYRYFKDKDEILAAVRAAAFNRFSEGLEAAVANAPDARSMGRAVGDAYVDFATRYPAAYQLIFTLNQPNEERYPELRAANARAQENMVDYVRRMIAAGLLEGDAQLIGYMFWASLHGIVVLDLGSGLRGMDGHTLREKIMRTLYAGMKVHPPRLDD